MNAASEGGQDPRSAYRDALIELAEADERVVCVDTDTGGLERTFGARFPDRYFNVGIAEANMFGISAGLAARGLLPYAHTMATFATLRAGEQLKLDIVGTGLPVRVVATHGGLSAAHFGTSHYALEDLAVTRALTGATIVVPADSSEIGPAMRALHDHPGPSYLRLGRSATPPVHTGPAPFTLGRAVPLRDGTDVCVLAMGPLPVLMALEAGRELEAAGYSCGVLQIQTLAPLDTGAVVEVARSTGGLVTVEEHRPGGGLGDAVAEAAGHLPTPHLRLAVRGRVGERVLGHREALEESGVSAAAVRDAAIRIINLRRDAIHG
ncbi:transketolase family protein [Nocardiopsis valliformis]|uniref:transketolase family protein n=1 Tax=Nocardiopsis valliformis TaxID=239974 RepID=UPI00034CE113|nr:transketolase C-terminal domain-containing protein [Nocardiopsis valliformis]